MHAPWEDHRLSNNNGKKGKNSLDLVVYFAVLSYSTVRGGYPGQLLRGGYFPFVIRHGAKELINAGQRPIAHVTKFANAVGRSVPAGGICAPLYQYSAVRAPSSRQHIINRLC